MMLFIVSARIGNSPESVAGSQKSYYSDVGFSYMNQVGQRLCCSAYLFNKRLYDQDMPLDNEIDSGSLLWYWNVGNPTEREE
jgi:hypothetical protein